MFSNMNPVIVRTEAPPTVSVPTMFVYHRDFPEVRGGAGSAEDATARLAELLSLTLDSAPSDWRRERIQQAIEDVLAFAKLGQG